MQRVFVLDSQAKPLMPCPPARARQLLKFGRAAIYRHYPFTIILKSRTGGAVQPLEARLDPGSRKSGIALIAEGQRGQHLVWATELQHRGQTIKQALEKRRTVRRTRRSRKTRYRAPRFLNRRRAEGWLPPSLQSRIENTLTWVSRLQRYAPVRSLALELVKFDTQLLQNPNISGVEYQQGELTGYEVREYLLEKWQRHCAYCHRTALPLQIEHLVPRSRGGTDRLSNLTLACTQCNQAKGTQTAEEFGYSQLQQQARQPLRDAAAVNATRYALYRRLQATGLPITTCSGGRTKYNRARRGYPKTHWIDAACVGERGAEVYVNPQHQPSHIIATGHGSRQMCRMDRFGFPRTRTKATRRSHGFQTGDLVKVLISSSKHIGRHTGRLAIRSSGSFNLTTEHGTLQGISYRYCKLLQHTDGYNYQKGVIAHSSPA